MKSVAILALLLAVVSANWSNHSNSSNTTGASVNVIFETWNRTHVCNVSAHFNHQDDVIITVSAPNSSNTSSPMLDLTNLAGEFWIQNASSILSVMNRTNSSITYKFRYWGVFTRNRPCVLGDHNMTCRFKLFMPAIQQFTDLFFTFDDPNGYMPGVKIVGAGYNNVTWDQRGIYVSEANYTEVLKRYINLTLSSDWQNKDKVRYLNWNALNFSASWMMNYLKPMYLGFQCWGPDYLNILANWTGQDEIWNNPVNLSWAGVPFDDFYKCNMSVVFTERSNHHALISIPVRGIVYINGSHSNHSNDTNTTTQSWAVYAGSNKGINITAEFTRWDGVDLTLYTWNSNQSVPMMNLTNYAGLYPVYNTSNIFRYLNRTSRSITYRFNYWDAIGSSGPCVSYDTYSVGCRFKLWLGPYNTTDLFVTIKNPFLGQNISISGAGYNNRTWSNDWIDLNEVLYTDYLVGHVQLTLDSDFYSQSPIRYLNRNATSFNASWMMASLKPVAFGFQCLDQVNYTTLNVVANFTPYGYEGFPPNIPVNLTKAGLPTYGRWVCNMTVVATESYNNHAMITIPVRSYFYINGSANYSGYWNGPQQRSNFSEYRPVQNTTQNWNQTYYNYTYYNQSRNSSYSYPNNTGYYYNQTYYNNSGYSNGTYYNQSRYNQNYSYGNSSYYYNYYNYSNTSNYSYSSTAYCDRIENKHTTYCLDMQVNHLKLMNNILIGCVAILALGLLVLCCKVCGQKKTPSRDNSPQNSYIEFTNTQTARHDPRMVIHNNVPTQPTVVPATQAYIVGGPDGGKFMVIPQKV